MEVSCLACPDLPTHSNVFVLRIIIYDRYGFHYEFVKELLKLPGVDYFPFTGDHCLHCPIFIILQYS